MRNIHYRKILTFLVLTVLFSCTRVDFKSEELQPIQSNFSDDALDILVLTETRLVSREASRTIHKRKYTFPPRILIHVSADKKYKNTSFEVISVVLQTREGVKIFESSDIAFTLSDSWFKDFEKYDGHNNLKNIGGLNVVRDIFITPWINEVEVGQDYVFKLSYKNLEGIIKQIEIDYRAVSVNNRSIVPTKLYWNSK